MKLILLSCISALLSLHTLSQNVGVGTTTPNSAALLHVDLGSSVTNGVLITGIQDGSALSSTLGS